MILKIERTEPMFLTQQDNFSEYLNRYPMNLTWDQVDFITKNSLIEAMGFIEDECNPDDIDLYDAIVQTLSYFTSKEEQELLTMRNINSDWLNLVADQKVVV